MNLALLIQKLEILPEYKQVESLDFDSERSDSHD